MNASLPGADNYCAKEFYAYKYTMRQHFVKRIELFIFPSSFQFAVLASLSRLVSSLLIFENRYETFASSVEHTEQ